MVSLWVYLLIIQGHEFRACSASSATGTWTCWPCQIQWRFFSALHMIAKHSSLEHPFCEEKFLYNQAECLFAYLRYGNPFCEFNYQGVQNTKDYSVQTENFAQQFIAMQCQDPWLSQEHPKFGFCFTLSPIYEGPSIQSFVCVSQLGSASVTTLQASHVYYLKRRPNFIWREAQSHLQPPRRRVAPTNIPNLHLQHPPPRGIRLMQAHSLIPLSKCLRCLCNLLGLCRPLVGSLQRLLCRFCLPLTSSICKFWSYLLRCGQILGPARVL